MRRITLKPRSVRPHPDYEITREPHDLEGWQEEAAVARKGTAVHRELVHIIRRTLPATTNDQASQLAHEILALAARRSNGTPVRRD